jgi:hypothetical protein
VRLARAGCGSEIDKRPSDDLSCPVDDKPQKRTLLAPLLAAIRCRIIDFRPQIILPM